MASVMFTDCYSVTASRLVHSNRAYLTHRHVGQLCLRTSSAPGRGCVRSSAMEIDEQTVASGIFGEIESEVSRMKESIGVVPRLAVIRVGDKNKTHPASYSVPCGRVGIRSFDVRVAENSSQEEVLECVSRFNHDPSVHGIVVQLPRGRLPSHLDEYNILNAISVEKDVEGVHSLNIGELAMQGREPLFVPPAPKGCIELLHRYNFEIKGKRAVVLGRSKDFGMPAALLLQREDATVSIIHSKTNNPEEITRQADIVISAVGKQNMVRGSWIKPGAIVINVGRSLVQPYDLKMVLDFCNLLQPYDATLLYDATVVREIRNILQPNGHTLVRDNRNKLLPFGRVLIGDICFEEVCKVASAMTTASGGIFSITETMLLSNILTSAKRFHNFI